MTHRRLATQDVAAWPMDPSRPTAHRVGHRPTGGVPPRPTTEKPPHHASALIADAVAAALPPEATGAVTFWRHVCAHAPKSGNARLLVARMNLPYTTCLSRFLRADLPSPKTCLVFARLCLAADLLGREDDRIWVTAAALDFASPQAFGRHLRLMLGVNPIVFRERHSFPEMLVRLIDRLILPHADTWATFDPWAEGGRIIQATTLDSAHDDAHQGCQNNG